jgi:hypothetical protein
MISRRVRAILAVSTVFSLAGCGTGGTGSQASAPRTESPSPSVPAAAPGYKAYVSPAAEYSLEFPHAWFAPTEFRDGPHVGTDFVSQDIGSPMLLRDEGIWLTVQVNTQPESCTEGPGFKSSTFDELNVTIDGTPATAFFADGGASSFAGGDGLTGIAGPYVMHAGWCYSFGFLTTSAASTRQHLPEIEHIYSSFRFNR